MHQDTIPIDYDCKNHDPIEEPDTWLPHGGLNDHLNGKLLFVRKIKWFLGEGRLSPSKFQVFAGSHLTK